MFYFVLCMENTNKIISYWLACFAFRSVEYMTNVNDKNVIEVIVSRIMSFGVILLLIFIFVNMYHSEWQWWQLHRCIYKSFLTIQTSYYDLQSYIFICWCLGKVSTISCYISKQFHEVAIQDNQTDKNTNIIYNYPLGYFIFCKVNIIALSQLIAFNI